VGARPLFDETTARKRLGRFGFSGAKARHTQSLAVRRTSVRGCYWRLQRWRKPNCYPEKRPIISMVRRRGMLTALKEYEGAVVLNSHERRLIEGCADVCCCRRRGSRHAL